MQTRSTSFKLFGSEYRQFQVMQIIKESCAVCWRDFSSIVKPFSLTCGHSYCHECCILLKKCPLCRSRLIQSASRPTNYALLSLIEKTEQVRPPETKSQHVQTEEHENIDPRGRLQASNADHSSHSRSRPKKKEALKFKFTRGANGQLEGLEIAI